MDRDNLPVNKLSNSVRSKRVRRMKRYIIVTVILLLILPSILCFIMFFRMNSMQNELDELEQYFSAITTSSSNISSDSNTTEIVQGYETHSIDEKVNYINEVNQDTYMLAGSESAVMNGNVLSKDESLTKEVMVNSKDYKVIVKENIDFAIDKKATTQNTLGTETYYISEATTDPSTKIKITSSKPEKIITSEVKTDLKTEIKSNQTKIINNATVNTDAKASKKVYITFDDGPSKYTAEILDLLADYNVKATFFVIGKTDKESKELYKRIIEEGHTLGMHSYSHNYKIIYNSLEDFEKDFKKIRKLLYDTTGRNINIYRFPGGSGNSVSIEDVSVFIDYLNKNGVIYYDWNVISGDATGEKLSSQEMYQNVMDGVKANKTSIVLMHDTDAKKYTIETLQKILEDLIKQGIEILPLDENVSPMHQVTGGSVLLIE